MAEFNLLNKEKNEHRGISLEELNNRIKRVLALNFTSAIWIRAEIASLKVSNGHRYLDLVQKEENSDLILARAQANLWAGNYLLLKKQFTEDIDLIVKDGQEVLLEVKVNFHPQYGMSLQIINIDPDFTIGKYFSKKQQLFAQVQKEKLDQPQKQLYLSPVMQKIAVISSSKAAGYIDFIQQLESVSGRMDIESTLFESPMQGSSVEPGMINALEAIQAHWKKFDLVVIIRGGGAKLDLMDFDNYQLAKKIARFSIPVLTGIGHEIDLSLLDIVAAIHQKTPTAAAQFIISTNDKFAGKIEVAKIKIAEAAIDQLNQHKTKLERLRTDLINQTKINIMGKQHIVNQLRTEIILQCRFQFQKNEEKFKQISRELDISNPTKILKRGFSICSLNGTIIHQAEQLVHGDKITIKFFEGNAVSTVIKTYEHE